jgi:hypothetical protein
MPRFVSQWNLIDGLEDAKISGICQDNNEDNKQREENGEPLHPQDRFACKK